ncbi:hypothetical protein NPIL_333601 [Nephila pilipes]|uniref:Uncharacterized protein n=1 Tax=Nephila pilipes TaxID=299642 RepID=A0A8X6NRN1_NEPPI|nr:hypothetical protein NPIL_333601 [Nephila pilipes]
MATPAAITAAAIGSMPKRSAKYQVQHKIRWNRLAHFHREFRHLAAPLCVSGTTLANFAKTPPVARLSIALCHLAKYFFRLPHHLTGSGGSTRRRKSPFVCVVKFLAQVKPHASGGPKR